MCVLLLESISIHPFLKWTVDFTHVHIWTMEHENSGNNDQSLLTFKPLFADVTGVVNLGINPDFRIENFHVKHEISLLHCSQDYPLVSVVVFNVLFNIFLK